MGILSFTTLWGEERYCVLLLNSYHKGNPWTDEITKGVEDTFRGEDIDLHVEYLDTKRFVGELYFNRLAEIIALKHESYTYDALIVSDNNAFDFYLDKGEEVFGSIPLFFCGYNYLSESDLSGVRFMSGVNERTDIESNIQLVESIHKNTEKIVIISDSTTTGMKINREVERIRSHRKPNEPDLELIHHISMDSLKHKLSSLQEGTIVILTVFSRDSEGTFYDFDENTRLITDASAVPVYGSWTFQLGNGIVGGYLVDAYQQGAEVASLVLEARYGEGVESIPVQYDTPLSLLFDFRELERRNITRQLLPEDAVILFEPHSFYQRYRNLIVSITGGFVLLSIVLLALLFSLIVSRRAEKKVRGHQRELLKEKNYVQRIINNAPSLICGLDGNGVVRFINPVVEKITGYREEEIIGRNFWKLFYPGDEFEQVRQLLKDSVEGVIIDYEMTMTTKSGEKRTIVWNSFARRNSEGEISGYLGFGYDISKLKKTEQNLYEVNRELIVHRDHLEDLVADRTMELRISLEHLQLAQKKLVEAEKMAALGGLVAGVAHEINTPVGIGVTAASHLEVTVREFCELYDEGRASKRNFDRILDLCRESSAIILSNMKRAASLIQSFKQVAVDQSSHEIRRFYIGRYVDEVLMSLKAELRNSPCTVKTLCPVDFQVTTYPGALSQVLTNLIMNSIIHGFEEQMSGAIVIDVKKSGSNVLIIYSDTGKGIHKENLKRIFDPFFTTRRGSGGSGLGLNIVYNLVTQTLGGQISCTSTVGEGTWFELEFPAEVVEKKGPPLSGQPSS